MALIQCEKLVPEVYVNESRDFQLLCRAFNTILNSSKWYIDGIRNTVDTKNISSNLLPLLKTKVGFFDGESLDYESLRWVVDAFPYIMKYKGSKLGVRRAVQLYLKTQNLKTNVEIDFINKDGSPLQDVYQIKIGIRNSAKVDIKVLREICNYIIPTGYVLYFYIYEGPEINQQFVIHNKADMTLITNDYNSMVAGTMGNLPNKDYPPNNNINTQAVDTVDIINSKNEDVVEGQDEIYEDAEHNTDLSIKDF